GQPTSGTASLAGLLAIGLALLGAYSGYLALDAAQALERLDLGGSSPDTTGLRAIGGLNLVVAALWLLGGMMLLGRKPAGRTILIALACLGGLGNLISGLVSLANDVPAAGIGSLIGVAVAATVLGLCLAGSTTRWLASAPSRPGPRPGHPYGQPPNGQAPYGQAPNGQAPYGQAPYGQAPYGQPPYGGPAAPPQYPYGQAAPPHGQYPPYV